MNTTFKKPVLIILLIFGCLVFRGQSALAQELTPKPKPSDGSRNFGYYEYLPAGYNAAENASRKYPVILFLHGLGEKGNGTTQLSWVLRNGPPKELSSGMNLPFIVISPQLTSLSYWTGANTHQILSYMLSNYRIDADSVFLTGLSLGGEGTLVYLTHPGRHPVRAAAAVCPPTNRVDDLACEINGVPLRLWHNRQDPTVGWSSSENLVKWIDACSSSPTQKLPIFHTIASTSHNAWSQAYDDPFGAPNGIYTWFKGGLGMSSSGFRVKEVSNTNPTTFTVVGSAWDINGSIVSYSWSPVSPTTSSVIDGTTTNDTLRLKNLTIGTYKFKLTVTNNQGETISDNFTLNVTRRPVPNPGPAKTITLPQSSLTIIGSATDPDGDTFKEFRWKSTARPTGAAIPTITKDTWGLDDTITISNLKTAGTYTFTMAVIDSKYAYGSSTFTVTVNPASSTANARMTESSEATLETATTTVYPVPFNNNLTLDLGKPVSGNISLRIADGFGKSIFFKEPKLEDEQIISLNLESEKIQNGTYYMHIKLNNKPYKVMRIVKNPE